jgi:hypothetical protein
VCMHYKGHACTLKAKSKLKQYVPALLDAKKQKKESKVEIKKTFAGCVHGLCRVNHRRHA